MEVAGCLREMLSGLIYVWKAEDTDVYEQRYCEEIPSNQLFPKKGFV